MPRDFDRTRRIAEQIQRELAKLIQMQMKDPRLGMVTVASVEVSRDLSNAKVYVTVFNKDDNPKIAIEILQNAAGYLRHELGKLVKLRILPQLRFIYDDTVAKGAHMSALIARAVAEDAAGSDEDGDGK